MIDNLEQEKVLIYTDSKQTHEDGTWRFVVQSLDSDFRFEASDIEQDTLSHRLALLAVVRALESLPNPSSAKLVTTSRYVRNGFRHGLEEWKEQNWMWERFGNMVPVKNDDLWKRVYHALTFHTVDCRIWRQDAAEQRSKNGTMGRKPNFLKRQRKTSRPRLSVY